MIIRRALGKLLAPVVFSPSISTRAQEVQLIDELRAKFRALPPKTVDGAQPSEAVWAQNMNRLRALVLDDDPKIFLSWDVIRQTMVVESAPYIRQELRYLQGLENWKGRWRRAIFESKIGCPWPFFPFPRSSGNLIHHGYHLAKYEEKTGTKVNEHGCVLEFGGGYGSMCRLFHNLGFNGKYIIFDLPHFSALQAYYLKSLDIPIHSPSSFQAARSGVVCISNMEELARLMPECHEGRGAMFVATWSLSETPISLRDQIVSLPARFKSFLVAYQDRFGEVDNLAYFEKWKHRFDSKIEWRQWHIEHLPNNYYLIGHGSAR